MLVGPKRGDQPSDSRKLQGIPKKKNRKPCCNFVGPYYLNVIRSPTLNRATFSGVYLKNKLRPRLQVCELNQIIFRESPALQRDSKVRDGGSNNTKFTTRKSLLSNEHFNTSFNLLESGKL